MNDSTLFAFGAGAIALGYVIGSAFFWRFWSRTRDSLFLVFAAAFALMAVNQAVPTLFGIPREEQEGVYLLRLAAFVLIIMAILRKNLQGRSRD